MALVSMLLIIAGAGAVLLSIAWLASDGVSRANIQPAGIGAMLLAVALALPVGPLGDGDGPGGAPPPGPPPPGVPMPPGHGPSGPVAKDLSLPLTPSITTRLRFACTVTDGGKGSCWGEPVPLPDGAISRIVLGREHGCALLQTGELSCWGEAQLGASRLSSDRFVDAAATLETICAVTHQGALKCFGKDIGMPTGTHRLTAVSGGAHHFCGLTDSGQALCWGDDTDGQLAAPGDARFKALSAGHFHTCGITKTGEVLCWGRDSEGQASPQRDTTIVQISSGWAHTCGLTSTGRTVCWGCQGRHRDLQVGGAEACTPPELAFTAVSAGDLWQSCGVTLSGETACWGGLERVGGPL